MVEIKFRKFEKIWNYELEFTKDKNLNDFVIYTDTDSMFCKLPVFSSKLIDDLMIYTQKVGRKFGILLNNNEYKDDETFQKLTLKPNFKKEFALVVGVFYAKKSYIGITLDGKAILTGVEGKKQTAKFVQKIVEDFIESLRNKETLENLERISTTKYLYNKYLEYLKNILAVKSIKDSKDLLFPFNVSQEINHLKNVTAIYKGAIVFDIFAEEILGFKYWEYNITGKSYLLYIEPKTFEVEDKVFKEFSKYPQIKNHEIKTLTIPAEFIENEQLLEHLDKYFKINYEKYNEVLIEKMTLIYRVLNEKFFMNLNTPKINILCIENDYMLLYSDIILEKREALRKEMLKSFENKNE